MTRPACWCTPQRLLAALLVKAALTLVGCAAALVHGHATLAACLAVLAVSYVVTTVMLAMAALAGPPPQHAPRPAAKPSAPQAPGITHRTMLEVEP